MWFFFFYACASLHFTFGTRIENSDLTTFRRTLRKGFFDKETRKPPFRGISKTFLISKKDCQRRRINPILANMKPDE